MMIFLSSGGGFGGSLTGHCVSRWHDLPGRGRDGVAALRQLMAAAKVRQDRE